MHRPSTTAVTEPVSLTVFGEFAVDLLNAALQESQSKLMIYCMIAIESNEILANCKIMVQLVNKLIFNETIPRDLMVQIFSLTKKLQEVKKCLSFNLIP